MPLSVDKALRKAQSLIKKGRSDDAEALYQQLLAAFPQSKKALRAHADLTAKIDSGATPSAEPTVDAAREIADLLERGEFVKTLHLSDNMLRQLPHSSVLHNVQGAAHRRLGNFDQAVESFKKVLQIAPNNALTHNNLGVALTDIGALTEAVESFNNALEIDPDYADAYFNLAVAQGYQGDIDAAIDSYKHTLTLTPGRADAHYNMGNALLQNQRPDAAIDCYRRATQIAADYSKAYNNWGNVLKTQNELPAAIARYQQALDIHPDYANARVHKLHLQAMICDWAAVSSDPASVASIGISGEEVAPFSMLTLEDAPERHRLRSELFTQNNFSPSRLPAFTTPADRPQKLRIGYFSADFHNHATMYLIARLFEAHQADNFELYAYSFGPDKHDSMRQRLIEAAHLFTDVRELQERDIALLARQHGLHIAVDLKGYTQNNRSAIFAHRAAPVQINYLGYPGTMGADFIDYIIADAVVIPPVYRDCYTEKIIQMPYSYQVNDATRAISEQPVTRAKMGLPAGAFVFCCFNNSYKITADEFDVWMRLLKNVDGSVLWLMQCNSWAEQNLKQQATARGIDCQRLIFAETLPQAEHLARHRLADLFVDTFVVNAHTTASDALWAGLPVVTKLGQGFAARVAGSLLTALGLPELITRTTADYEALILELAYHPKSLAAIRQKLKQQRLSAALFDSKLFAQHLEEGYRTAYDRYFDQHDPEHIEIEP